MSVQPRSPRIPLSPSSPPETGLKRRRESDGETKRPPTPEYMSVATKSYVSNYHTQNMDEAASRSSPRSPASSASYNNNNSTQRTSQPYSTSASSVSGNQSVNMAEQDPDQHRDKRQRMENPMEEKTDVMDVDDGSLLPTNHERSKNIKANEPTSSRNVMADLSRDEIEESLDQLRKDMGEPHLLRKSSKTHFALTMPLILAY